LEFRGKWRGAFCTRRFQTASILRTSGAKDLAVGVGTVRRHKCRAPGAASDAANMARGLL
jgi:hypothetical protein